MLDHCICCGDLSLPVVTEWRNGPHGIPDDDDLYFRMAKNNRHFIFGTVFDHNKY